MQRTRRNIFITLVLTITLLIISIPVTAQQQTIPQDLRTDVTDLENKMSAYNKASTLFQKSFIADSARLAFVIEKINSIKAGAPDAMMQRNEKLSELTAEFSNLSSNLLDNIEKSFHAVDGVDEQIGVLLSKLKDNKTTNNQTPDADIFSTEGLVFANEGRAENYEIARGALKDEIDAPSVARMDDEAGEDFASRDRSIESAKSVMVLMRSILGAQGVAADSNLTDVRTELVRLQNTLHTEKRNLWITISPYVLWSEEIGPTLALRQKLAKIRSLCQELQRPSFNGMNINVPTSPPSPIIGWKNSSPENRTTSVGKKGGEYLKKARQDIEKRRNATQSISEERSDEQ